MSVKETFVIEIKQFSKNTIVEYLNRNKYVFSLEETKNQDRLLLKIENISSSEAFYLGAKLQQLIFNNQSIV